MASLLPVGNIPPISITRVLVIVIWREPSQISSPFWRHFSQTLLYVFITKLALFSDGSRIYVVLSNLKFLKGG